MVIWDAMTLFWHHCNVSELDECASDPCQQNGTCVDKFNGYICTCPSRYRGANCETGECPWGTVLKSHKTFHHIVSQHINGLQIWQVLTRCLSYFRPIVHIAWTPVIQTPRVYATRGVHGWGATAYSSPGPQPCTSSLTTLPICLHRK